MTINMDIWDTLSETKDQNEKQSESLHSKDDPGKQEYTSVISVAPKENESNSTIPSPDKKCEINASDRKKDDTEREEVSVPGTSCKCTLCDVVLTSPHSLTQHIRQHNVNNQTNTCRICRKTLSSASSLDRHMLVHSGERPFKCKLCNMAFTTNGNMHRHMRTHGEVAGEYSEATSENKETKQRHGLKRRFSSESDSSSFSNQMETAEATQEQKELVCPVCAKTFLCKYGLHNHMETHPNDPIKCPDCLIVSPDYSAHVKHQCLAIRNTNGNNMRVGFHDLSFVDFSTDNFSLVAKNFCERNSRRPSSAFHKFECAKCSAAFPCGRALKLHEMIHGDTNGTYCLSCKCDFPNPTYLYAHQLKHRSVEQCWNEIKRNSNKDDGNKDDFLVLFGLKTNKGPKDENDVQQIKEEQFENLSYFVFGKKNAEEKLTEVVSEADEQEKRESSKQSVGSDFADIQSIISLTSNTPLMPSVRSSPAMASPASPSKIASCALPESPPIADSAQASPETPPRDDDCIVTKEPPLQNDSAEEPNGVEQNPAKRQRITVFQNKSYSCHKCKYTSLDKGTLKRHLRTHNGERPFQCTICSYAFTTKANCERHVKKCHKITEKEEVACAMRYNPNMMETKDSDIQSLESTSLETVCKYCNVDFKNQRVLRHHLRSLNNSCSQKPFLCTVCKAGFSTKNNCMRHVTKQHPHLKEKPSEAVLMTASNTNPSPQEPIPPTDSGISSFVEEPLNLSVRETICDMEIERSNKSDIDSIEDIVNAAKGLVCLSEMPPPQEQPLDLTLHPLDLTTKPKKFLVEDIIDSNSRYASPIHGNIQQFCCENSCSTHSDFFSRDSMVTSSPVLSEETQQTTTMMPCCKTNNQSLLSNTDRQFICRYCSAGFTLKSNMERHIKRKHPEYARPTRSRNYVSAVSLGNEKPTSGLAVSTQTRNALRFVLNNKALSSSNQELLPENLSVQQQNESIPSTAGKFDVSEGHSPEQPPQDAENAVDLASISDVIDTANSQEFKRYLKETRTDGKHSLTDFSKGKEKKQCSPASSQIEKFITRKRNSYADSPNSIACPYCKRRFPWRSSLRRHVLTHTGQKPFKCPKCPIWFTTKSNCERHFGRKHKVNNDFGNRSVPERPFKCHLCTSSTFSTQGNLRKHFYLKHWTKTRSGKHQISEFLSSPKDGADATEDETKEKTSLPVIPECDILNNYHPDSDSKIGGNSSRNGVMYCCHCCYKKSYTREECLEHLVNCYASQQNSVKDGNISEELCDTEKERDADEKLVVGGHIEDGAQSKIACAFCSNVFSFHDEFLLHMKVHIRKLENTIAGANGEKKNGGQNDLCNSSLLNTRNRRSNSLLYLMQSGKGYNSAWSASEWKRNDQNEDNTDLIQNLLGIQDSKMIDEMLDSADSAARLLGVEEV